ncbi:MAG: FG-GAP-like repeat-containing protein [Bacteroidota bacterium]
MRNNTGVAVADYDQDGDLDVFMVAKVDYSAVQPATWSRLFRNENDGTFEDVTLEAGFGNLHNYDLSDPGWELGVKMGASWGDYDNDGFPDLLLTNYHSVQLFHNEGDGTFTEQTTQAGLPIADSCYYFTALWWDVNRDGWLDLFLPNWLGCTEKSYYESNGDGTFTNRTAELGLAGTEEGSLMSVPIDANGDGRWDLFVANDFSENELFIQQADGTFLEEALAYGVAADGNDMGMAIGDINQDGTFEVYISNIAENRLFVQNEQGTYDDLAEEMEVYNTYWGWDTRFADMDLDGDEDLLVLNGYESDVIFFPVFRQNFYFKKEGIGEEIAFVDASTESGFDVTANSISMGVFDYDNDGDLDVLISNTDDTPLFFENPASDAQAAHWAQFHLQGTLSNRDGLGSQVSVWSGGKVQHRLYYGAGFMSQHLQGVHVGLGEETLIDSVIIRWNSGLVERYEQLPADQHFRLIENQGITPLDRSSEKVYGCTDPQSCSYDPLATVDDGSCSYLPAPIIRGNAQSGYLTQEVYRCEGQGNVPYQWKVEHGEILSGQGTASVVVQWEMESEGQLWVTETGACESLTTKLPVSLNLEAMQPRRSVARLWNEALLYAIRRDFARPTVHARNLFHASIAMFDAWAVYDVAAEPYLLGKSLHGFQSEFAGYEANEPTETARDKSISYAAFRLLTHRFSYSPGARKSKLRFTQLMEELGYDPGITSVEYASGDPAALGNFIAQTIIDYGLQDGSREATDYDNAFYAPVNPPLITTSSGNDQLADPNRWQPLALETFVDQSGNFIEGSTPAFLSPEWGQVQPFSLSNQEKLIQERDGHPFALFHDPGSPPYLQLPSASDPGSQAYQWGFSLVSIWGAQLSPDDGVVWDISPAGIGNLALEDLPREYADYPDFYRLLEGGDISPGHAQNPATGEPYEPQLVPRGDYARVLAEFWADGPDSETPPGHWFVILNKVSDHSALEKRWQGKGTLLDPLEWDVKTYFTLSGGMHDAAISAWSVKGWYDYLRPISAIRYLAELGQSSEPSQPNYDPAGIPLVEGLVELVGANDPLAGANGQHIGNIKLYSWRGHAFINDPETEAAGVGWILAEDWMPYQRISFVTPPFAGYVSGHSTYSRAAAEIMTLMTGNAFFPGGMGEFWAYKNEFLVFEEGPSQDVLLQWATYRDASDQCSLSRIWGGIHPPADDLPGRFIGEEVGKEAFALAGAYFAAGLAEITAPVFPNPIRAGDIMTLTVLPTDEVLELLNLQGQLVARPAVDRDPLLGIATFRLPNLPAGTYLLKAGSKSWKIVVW